MIAVTIKRLHPDAILPAQAKAGDAAYDLYANEHVTLMPGQRALIKTGIAMAIPRGCYGRIADRSGLALKHGLHVLGGVIDSGYRGDIGVVLVNLDNSDEAHSYSIAPGDRIAQIIFEYCHEATFVVVDDLDATSRASGGFGSSGT